MPLLLIYGLTESGAWTSNHTHGFIWDVIIHPFLNFNGSLTKPLEFSRAWMNIYIPLFYMGVITYSCPNPDAGVTNLG